MGEGMFGGRGGANRTVGHGVACGSGRGGDRRSWKRRRHRWRPNGGRDRREFVNRFL
jgi:hypothetical protein